MIPLIFLDFFLSIYYIESESRWLLERNAQIRQIERLNDELLRIQRVREAEEAEMRRAAQVREHFLVNLLIFYRITQHNRVIHSTLPQFILPYSILLILPYHVPPFLAVQEHQLSFLTIPHLNLPRLTLTVKCQLPYLNSQLDPI